MGKHNKWTRQPPADATPAMLTITHGHDVAGFILRRARGFEAFDRNGRPIAVFKTQSEAVKAIPTPAKEGAR